MTDIIVLFCTTTLGYLIGQAYESRFLRREMLYANLLEFSSKFKANVCTSRVVLAEFANQFCLDSSKDFCAYCNKMLFGRGDNINLIKGKEYKYLHQFFVGLNAENCQSLLEHLSFYSNYFNDMLIQVKNENKTKGKIGQKLGVLCGVIVGLVLI